MELRKYFKIYFRTSVSRLSQETKAEIIYSMKLLGNMDFLKNNTLIKGSCIMMKFRKLKTRKKKKKLKPLNLKTKERNLKNQSRKLTKQVLISFYLKMKKLKLKRDHKVNKTSIEIFY
jgi:hypothetical protein